ncbi:MAG: DNA polymerase III [Candidatus Sungbacteria bacterium RIFCSPLOWO2_02_FULL_54_10]|uniref:DNA polymerase III n=2 Tax=Candidatus Sungiibacteriota TaxID=1817917 RepID=A0A1G2L7T1_9BACT|nr:MAG: DNA polymerase III [Candidatus Sungbacteria bacterium RIFCSPHIGHO2_01_FULL_54_26]OHA03092.1 MAG: DNA polymerase III [Candidatus Sungbacteria bacterium RIFCSPHIGHO2_02_FULL_53_17]OHA07718.1 MAG: DNA polymerase III [Candidatus Sungbacteria bacterium RIFCSPLOWO2_01_FULL_54_21]OHA12187.1 MAG: DNA polymerase III [Candidatus Sungbacteria bacterium RIFCSPLOWO2_02_FULL_54_10]
MTNRDIVTVLREMAALLEMEGVAFKPRAYEKAAAGVEAWDTVLADAYKRDGIKALKGIPAVGRGIASHIAELLEKGRIKAYEDLHKKVPVNVTELLQVEGVGPKMLRTLWEKLRVCTLADLEMAAQTGKIGVLPRFGEKSEQRILKSIEFLRASGGRRTLGSVLPEVLVLEVDIRAFPEVSAVVAAGSIRRRKETVGDIDILVASAKPKRVTERFLALPQIAHVYGSGDTKTNVRLKNGLDCDLRVVPPISWGAAFQYFTGSKDHNVALREVAIKKGYKLNEYGLFKDQKMIVGKTEKEIYKALGLPYIEPELREDTGEIEAARKNHLPALVEYSDLKGDLQVQTDWTDGEDSIEKMAEAAMAAGLEYIAITDHTKSLAMTGGADEKKLLRQMGEIDKLNKKFKGKKFKILKGAEVNIGKDGSLDIDDRVLAQLDVAGAAVHSHFNLTRAAQTARVIRAMENPHIDIIFHLTGRIIGKRPAIDLDIGAVIAAAKRTGTVLEVNAYPDRLDIKDEHVRKAVASGVKLSIDSDAHAIAHFKLLEYGIATARRGWAEKKDIINAWPVEKMLKMLK